VTCKGLPLVNRRSFTGAENAMKKQKRAHLVPAFVWRLASRENPEIQLFLIRLFFLVVVCHIVIIRLCVNTLPCSADNRRRMLSGLLLERAHSGKAKREATPRNHCICKMKAGANCRYDASGLLCAPTFQLYGRAAKMSSILRVVLPHVKLIMLF